MRRKIAIASGVLFMAATVAFAAFIITTGLSRADAVAELEGDGPLAVSSLFGAIAYGMEQFAARVIAFGGAIAAADVCYDATYLLLPREKRMPFRSYFDAYMLAFSSIALLGAAAGVFGNESFAVFCDFFEFLFMLYLFSYLSLRLIYIVISAVKTRQRDGDNSTNRYENKDFK